MTSVGLPFQRISVAVQLLTIAPFGGRHSIAEFTLLRSRLLRQAQNLRQRAFGVGRGRAGMGDPCGLWRKVSKAWTPIHAINISRGRPAWRPFVALKWISILPSAFVTSGSTGQGLKTDRIGARQRRARFAANHFGGARMREEESFSMLLTDTVQVRI